MDWFDLPIQLFPLLLDDLRTVDEWVVIRHEAAHLWLARLFHLPMDRVRFWTMQNFIVSGMALTKSEPLTVQGKVSFALMGMLGPVLELWLGLKDMADSEDAFVLLYRVLHLPFELASHLLQLVGFEPDWAFESSEKRDEDCGGC